MATLRLLLLHCCRRGGLVELTAEEAVPFAGVDHELDVVLHAGAAKGEEVPAGIDRGCP